MGGLSIELSLCFRRWRASGDELAVRDVLCDDAWPISSSSFAQLALM